MKVKDLASKVGEVIELKGWVANKRESKTVAFVILRDGSGQCQCIIDVNNVGEKVFNDAKTFDLGVKSIYFRKGC